MARSISKLPGLNYNMNHPDSDDHQSDSDDMVICDSGFLKPGDKHAMLHLDQKLILS